MLEPKDGASTLRPQIASGKAGTALALGVSSRQVAAMAAERLGFIAALGPISPLGVVPAAGGALVVDDERRVIGAVGVTGDTSDNDELCARAGIATAGLVARPNSSRTMPDMAHYFDKHDGTYRGQMLEYAPAEYKALIGRMRAAAQSDGLIPPKYR